MSETLVVTLYRADGSYLHEMQMPDLESVELNTPAGAIAIFGHFGENTFLKDGEPVQMPPRPAGSFWRFDPDTESWLDPRSSDEKREAIYEVRARTVIEKTELLNRMLITRWLSPEDFRIAMRGNIPPALQPILDEMDETARLIAENKWHNDMVISRMNPIVLLMAHAMEATPEDMDALFSVILPD